MPAPDKYFNNLGKITKSHSVGLPHWDQDGVSYFITFRLADSIPKEALRKLELEKKMWLSRYPKPWSDEDEAEYNERFSLKIEKWLDKGYGKSVFRNPRLNSLVADIFLDKNGFDYSLNAFVIMPNHVHMVVSKLRGSLAKTMQGIKGNTSIVVNRELQVSGSLWQKGYFDRIIRDSAHYHRCVRYIRNNPEKARLGEGQYYLWEAE